MRVKTALAISFLSLATVLYILTMTTPWWYTRIEVPQNSNVTSSKSYCWIDGTCRTGSWAYKDNKELQGVFDSSLIIMVVFIVPFLSLWHTVLWRRSGRFSIFGSRVFLITSGIFSFGLCLAGILTFSIGISKRSSYSQLFGNETATGSLAVIEWGASWGWFFAIATAITLIPSIALGASINKRVDGIDFNTPLLNESQITNSKKGVYRKEDKTAKVTASFVAPDD